MTKAQRQKQRRLRNIENRRARRERKAVNHVLTRFEGEPATVPYHVNRSAQYRFLGADLAAGIRYSF